MRSIDRNKYLIAKKYMEGPGSAKINIMQTSPCNEYPLTPHFYVVKLGLTGVYLIFLFLL